MKRFILSTCSIVILIVLLGTVDCYCNQLKDGVSKNDFNIVLITIDTLRVNNLSCYGYERNTSPHIDSIAKQGITFVNAIAPSSWTAPSMVSLFTSVYPINHGVVRDTMSSLKANKKETISDKLTTLAEVLKRQGYNTFGVVSNLHLQGKFGFSRGFNHFKCLKNWSPAPLVNQAIDLWQDDIEKSKKFFLWVHYSDPHHPYHARNPWIGQYTSTALSQELNLSDKKMGELKKLIPLFKKNPQTLFNLVALYDSEINFVDSYVGELIQKFELDKKTLIIITSDHGEEFLEHGNLDHGNNLYQETIHVPLIIKLPHSIAKDTVEQSVNLIDVMPSILHFLNVDSPKQTLGKSFWEKEDLLSAVPEKLLRREELTNYNFSELDIRTVSKTMITSEWKYIYNYQNNTEELYRIKEDASELNNIAMHNVKQCQKLKEQLSNWASNAKKYPFETQSFLPSPEDLEKLKQLGYIE